MRVPESLKALFCGDSGWCGIDELPLRPSHAVEVAVAGDRVIFSCFMRAFKKPAHGVVPHIARLAESPAASLRAP